MSEKRDVVRERIIEINNKCYDVTQEYDRLCDECSNEFACEFLLAFDEWNHMHTRREAGNEDLERLVDAVMTVEDYEDLLKPNEEV